MIDFIVNNYIWFIIGGIVLIMVIIGYFAEKTDFGSKQIEKKAPRKDLEKEKTKEIEKAIEENDLNKGLGDLVLENADVNQNEDLNVPFGDTVLENTETNLNEDLNAPFGDEVVDTSSEEIPADFASEKANFEMENETISEDLNAPFGDEVVDTSSEEIPAEVEQISTEVEEMPHEEQELTEVPVDDFNSAFEEVPVQNLEVENTEPVSNEEDIWNF